MKQRILTTTAVTFMLVSLSGCSAALNDKDRAYMVETRTIAEDAKMIAQKAAADASASAQSAAAASQRAEQIYIHMQNK